MFFRRLVCVELIFSLLCLPLSVLADEVPAAEVNSNIVTEYNSADLKEPIVFDATETVAGVGEQLEIPAKSCILMEVKTGEILYENDSHLKLPPASITKVMALLLVMEAIDSGQLSLDTVLTASPTPAQWAVRKFGLSRMNKCRSTICLKPPLSAVLMMQPLC